jgi:bla regulator protein blaR1
MSEAAPRRRQSTHVLGLAMAACSLLLVRCAVPQAASPATPPAPVAPAAVPADTAPAALPAWEVSTVKPSSPDQRGMMIQMTPDGIRIVNVPLWMIVREAFGVNDDHLFGGPGWSRTRSFDIEGKVAPEDAPKLKAMKIDQKREMVVALLEERFGMKFHHETRDLPMYELVLARGGVKMQASKPANPDDPPPEPPTPGQPPKPGRHSLMMNARGHVESTGTDMSSLARFLSGQLGRTVVNKTGLTGGYDYKLDWTSDDTSAVLPKAGNSTPGENPASQDTGGPSLFTALEEQLGLKLEATKGPADVIVIDDLEQPTAN